MIKQLFIIGLGGGIGSIFRYLMQISISSIIALTFPFGTLIVNITGCFLIGILYVLFEKHTGLNTDLRLFLITGLCGGYTTFSSYSYESITLFRQENYLYFFLYLALSVLLGLLATLGGIMLMNRL